MYKIQWLCDDFLICWDTCIHYIEKKTYLFVYLFSEHLSVKSIITNNQTYLYKKVMASLLCFQPAVGSAGINRLGSRSWGCTSGFIVMLNRFSHKSCCFLDGNNVHLNVLERHQINDWSLIASIFLAVIVFIKERDTLAHTRLFAKKSVWKWTNVGVQFLILILYPQAHIHWTKI